MRDFFYFDSGQAEPWSSYAPDCLAVGYCCRESFDANSCFGTCSFNMSKCNSARSFPAFHFGYRSKLMAVNCLLMTASARLSTKISYSFAGTSLSVAAGPDLVASWTCGPQLRCHLKTTRKGNEKCKCFFYGQGCEPIKDLAYISSDALPLCFSACFCSLL